MDERKERLEEVTEIVKDRLDKAEEEKERARVELEEMKRVACEANIRLTEAIPIAKVADAVVSGLDFVSESLSKSVQELIKQDNAIASLEHELEKAEELEVELAEKDVSIEKVRGEMGNAKYSQAQALDLLCKSKQTIQELEEELAKGKVSETIMLDSLTFQTKELGDAKVLLQQSKLKIASLHEKVERLQGSSGKERDEERNLLNDDLRSIKSEIALAANNVSVTQEGEKHLWDKRLHEEVKLLKSELKQTIEAEENSKRAMDGLALALKEVATEANQVKEKLMSTQEELEHYKNQVQELKKESKNMEEKYRFLLQEAKKEADRYRNTSERLRLEAEESIMAWNGKEMGFVECIKRAEEEKDAELEENQRLLESLEAAENTSRIAKEETQKLRDILKQALNEANVAKEAAGIAQAENSQLKDILAEKDDALVFITRENENLRIKEAISNEEIKDLKRMLVEDKEQEQKLKSLASGKGFGCHLGKLIIPYKLHKETEEECMAKNSEKKSDVGDEESENGDPLKGSILDVIESPVVAIHHKKKLSSTFPFCGMSEESINLEDFDQVVEVTSSVDESEDERNYRKKRALLRRFGEILTRRKLPTGHGHGHGHNSHSHSHGHGHGHGHGHRRDSSIGCSGDQDHRKELLSVGE